jgi:hypothetical protein
VNHAGDAAVRAALVIVLRHFYAKHFAEFAGLATKHHAMPRRGSFYNLETMPSSKSLHLGQIIGMRAMTQLEFFARKVTPFARKPASQFDI